MSEETKMPFCSCGSPAIVWLGVARDRVTPLCAEHAGEMKAYIERKWRGAFTGASVSPSPSQDNERRDCVAPSSHAEPGIGNPADEPPTRHRGVSPSPSSPPDGTPKPLVYVDLDPDSRRRYEVAPTRDAIRRAEAAGLIAPDPKTFARRTSILEVEDA